MSDVIVIGGGVIGLSIARELSRQFSVVILERALTGTGASHAAAGMLSPQSEAEAPGAFFELCMASFRRYPGFAEELAEETGVDPHYRDDGLIFLATSPEQMQILERRIAWQRQMALPAEKLSADDVQRLEPDITMPNLGAMHVPGDRQISPRRLLEALRTSCVRRGVEIRTGIEVQQVSVDSEGVTGIRTGNDVVKSRFVVVASGIGSSSIGGLDPQIPVYPRKGQILSLQVPEGTFGRLVRWDHGYAVPRRGGELVIGATNENVGLDSSLTVNGIGRLLAEAQRLSSKLASAPILDMWTGFRPATPDGLPVIGESGIARLFYATGHYRNGILLAPITADVIADLLLDRPPSVNLTPFSPHRLP